MHIGIKPQYLPSRKDETIKYIVALHKLYKSERYDALYVHGSSAIMSIELMIAWCSNCKVRIVHSHSTMCEHKKADKILRPLFYKLYTKGVACSIRAGEWLFAKKNGRADYIIARNGRDITTYKFDIKKRTYMRNKLGISDEKFAIGHVGNFYRVKNHVFIIKVFEEIVKLNPDARLYLIGSGELEKEIIDLVNALQLMDIVFFMGAASNVPDLLQAMDVMLLPSFYEGLPLSVVEWQIAGLPCVISDKISSECAYTELVHFKSLKDGYLSWAEEILRLGDKRSERENGANTYATLAMQNGYDIETTANTIQQLLEEVCS